MSGRDVRLVDGIGDAAAPYFNTVLSRYDLNTTTTSTLSDVLRTVQAAMTARPPFQNFSWPEVRERLVGVQDPPLPAGPVYNTIINIHCFAALDDAGEEGQLRFEAKQGYGPLAVSLSFAQGSCFILGCYYCHCCCCRRKGGWTYG